MNMNQFTQKSLEAVQSAQTIAQEYGNQQIEQAHLLYALLKQENGLIPQLLGNLGLTVPSFEAAVRAEVEKLPRVSVGGREAGKIYIAPDVDKALSTAESIAGSMKDEYVSVEHLFLALLDTANSSLKDLYRTYNITREGVLKALTAVRGGEVLSITPNEYKLLRVLTSSPGTVVTRRLLLEKLWDKDGNFIDDHTLTVTVNRLRSKIEDGTHTYIKTVRGMGYIWTGAAA